jgi:phosphatidylcholine synthase
MILRRLLAWSAHAYTALGLVCAAGIAVLLVRGGDEAFRLAFLLMIVATLVDATDGWWARRVGVKEMTPGFDGRRLDDLIDFQTYTCLPLLLLWRADVLGTVSAWWLLAPLVASAYGFCQVHAKTPDNYFLGFPSYWNVIALYLYLLRLPAASALAVLLVFAVLTFVPSRYFYPSRGGPGALFVGLFGGAWLVALLVILWQWQQASRLLVLASLAFPVYYLAGSWVRSISDWRRRSEGAVTGSSRNVRGPRGRGFRLH